MGELTLHRENLPATLEDLSRFVLVGREKLISVKAEIRAITKLDVAREVYKQKLEEQQMLSEALLDATTRLGEMSKLLPKAQGMRSDLEPLPTGGQKLGAKTDHTNFKTDLETHRTDAKSFSKPKHEVIKELGFSKAQMQRFETLADNKDLVEQVKASARERGKPPTQSEVLSLAKARNDRYQRDMQQIDEDYTCMKRFDKMFRELDVFEAERPFLDAVLRASTLTPKEEELFGTNDELDIEIDRMDRRIAKLTEIRNYFLTVKAKGGIYK